MMVFAMFRTIKNVILMLVMHFMLCLLQNSPLDGRVHVPTSTATCTFYLVEIT